MIYVNGDGERLVKGLAVGSEPREVVNPYSHRGCTLPPVAVALYDFIKESEANGNKGQDFETALMLFHVNWPVEYYVLLD